jgi:hypothetical protein
MARFGRQILEALHYLRVRGFRACHLHAGNVLLDHSGGLGHPICRLTGMFKKKKMTLSSFFLVVPTQGCSLNFNQF